MSWRHFQNVLKTSWRCLEDVLEMSWRLSNTSWRCFKDVLKTSLIRFRKTYWRRLEDVWPRRICWSWSRHLEDVFWRRISKANMFVLIKTSWRRLHQGECLLGRRCSVRPATSLKKRLWHRCFSVNFANFLRKPFLTEHLWWLLLNIIKFSNSTLVVKWLTSSNYLRLITCKFIIPWRLNRKRKIFLCMSISIWISSNSFTFKSRKFE